VRADVDRAIKESGCNKMIFLTDFFLAAKGSKDREFEQGKMMVDAAKAAKMEFVVFLSVGDIKVFTEKIPQCHHMWAKMEIEKYLAASGLKHSVLRPVAFFENLDDAGNWNPLKKGGVKFLTEASTLMVSTYDVGKAASVMLTNQSEWQGRSLECASYKGTIHEVAAALTKVSGVKSTGSVAMPICLRSLFLSDLHHMCLFFERGYPESAVRIEDFKAVVPDAMDAEAWFRYHRYYSDGTQIDPTGGARAAVPDRASCTC